MKCFHLRVLSSLYPFPGIIYLLIELFLKKHPPKTHSASAHIEVLSGDHVLNFSPLHVSCIFHVSIPLEKAQTLFIFCISLTKLGSQVGGTQISRALKLDTVLYFWFILENASGKCTSGYVEVFVALKSVTNIVTQPI